MLVRMPLNPIQLEIYHAATAVIAESPYFYYSYILRAYIFAHWGLDGLAVGDAYKTLLLIDEVLDEAGEYHAQAQSADTEHPLHERKALHVFKHLSLPTWITEHTDQDFDLKSIAGAKLLAYRLLVYILTNTGCLKSASEFLVQLTSQVSNGKQEDLLRSHLRSQVRTTLGLDKSPDDCDDKIPEVLPDRGFVQRLLYPWNFHEPMRYSESNLARLNTLLAKIAPKLQAVVTELPVLSTVGAAEFEKQLGLISTDYISPGEEVLSESSFLTANNRLYDPLCDACSGKLLPTKIGESNFVCSECDDTAFCSQACLDGAMATYHPAVCGSDADTTAKEPVPHEAADSLYFLLVGRALAFAEHQSAHPLELKETQFLWGEFVTPLICKEQHSQDQVDCQESVFREGPTLPFSFKYNIQYPIHFLEKMDVNIYDNFERYDFWVLETLFAKFRGVASGKVNAQGVPEISAVHPLWCLANHSCSPNVKWEWNGNIRFWARSPDELVAWGNQEGEPESVKISGIPKGSEILSHYCDIELSVQERREWAQGALGGECRCPRCVWESEKT